MSDIVERLRDWRSGHVSQLHLLMNEAAGEIERLRSWMRIQDAVIHSGNVAALTEAEREILPVISKTLRGRGWRDWSDVIDGLLERL